MKRPQRAVLFVLMLAGATALAKGKAAKLPDTPKKPVTDTYFGVQVTDDYRWLEAPDDPAVKAWSDAENTVARKYLDAAPHAKDIRARLKQLIGDRKPDYGALSWRKGTFFALRMDPKLQQPVLVTVGSLDDLSTVKPIVDPNAMDKMGGIGIDWYVPSLDGKLVAVSMSPGGSEDGTLHIFEVASGKEVGEPIPRVNGGTAGGSMAWLPDASGFYYTRYPHEGERPAADLTFYQQIWLHKMGSKPETDTYVLGKEFPRIAEIALSESEDGAWVLAQVANGDGGEFDFWLLGPKGQGQGQGKWMQIAKLADKIVDGRIGRDGAIYLLSRKDAPRGKVLRMPLDTPSLAKAKVLLPEAGDAITRFVPTATRLYAVYSVGGPTELRAFDLSGKALGVAPSLPVSSIYGPFRMEGDQIGFRNESYIQPGAWYLWTAGADKTTPTALKTEAPADMSPYEAVREEAISKDGTKVPLNIIRRKGVALDGKNPTLLTGYGGYGISMTPGFDSGLVVWLEQGGVWAEANLRGGGEFGEAWHLAGNLSKKQNVFDDMAACAQKLIEDKLTSPEHLSIIGGSNGGLLMGAMIVQHPELFRAVVSIAGVYDMLRVENDSNGAFNVTEYGSVKDETQFKALYAYSPFHNVKDGAAPPAILIAADANDPRVNPYHSRKMVARLQAANGSKHPVLLRTREQGGHGHGASLDEHIALGTDAYAFLFAELGVKWKKPPKPPKTGGKGK